MPDPERIYLDNAATSWPKPEPVYRAVDDYQRRLGAAAGRGAYREAAEVERTVAEARRQIALLLGAGDPRRIVFTFNGTDALNLALAGTLAAGDHVVTSVVEHNSVLRPLRHLEATRGISVTRVPCDGGGVVDPQAIRQALRRPTRLVVLVHASNVTGALQPIEAAGRLAREHGAMFLVDAAQSLGHLPIDVASLPIDMLAAPGHKGLLGPLGTGVLYIAPGVEPRLQCVRQGGTGTQSEEDRQPDSLPDKYESGNLNVAGIVGLREGVAYLRERTVATIRRHEMQLTAQLLERLRALPGVDVHGPETAEARTGVVSVSLAGYDPQEAAALLDATYSIQVRAGLHCAPLMHQALGTLARGGTVRFSIGPFNTEEQIATAARAVREVTGAMASN
jgi:cysteine desulfurase/selenocysteine lyase